MGTKKTIVILCRGNVLRSPAAGEMVKKLLEEHGLSDQYEVVTRGAQGVAPDDPIPPRFSRLRYYSSTIRGTSLQWLKEQGIDLSTHLATPIDRETAEAAATMFVVDERTHTSLSLLYPDQTHKIHMLSEIIGEHEGIPDPPYAHGRDQQILILDRIQKTVHDGFFQMLAKTDTSYAAMEHMNRSTPETRSARRPEQF